MNQDIKLFMIKYLVKSEIDEYPIKKHKYVAADSVEQAKEFLAVLVHDAVISILSVEEVK